MYMSYSKSNCAQITLNLRLTHDNRIQYILFDLSTKKDKLCRAEIGIDKAIILMKVGS